MFSIEFYSAADGASELLDFLDGLQKKSVKSKDDAYALLHQFRKKTQKTPRREIEKAKAERDDWISRKG